MKEKIKNALKQKYSKNGLSDEVIDGVATILANNVKEEAEIDTAVEGCETLVKVVQGSLDKERTSRSEAEKKLNELTKRIEEQEKQSRGQEGGEKKDEKPNDELSALLASIETLSKKVDGIVQERTQKNVLEQLKASLSENKVPESYYAPILEGRTFGDDFNASEYANKIVTDFKALQKDMVGENFKDVKPPMRGEEDFSKEKDPLAEMISKGTKEITENKNN